MSADKITDLETKLEALLSEESPTETTQKLRWLSEQLRQYLERWLGFAKMKDLSVEATLQNTVFFAVLAGINVINKHLERAKDEHRCPMNEWMEFRNAVEWIRRRPDRDELKIVEVTFDAFSKKLNDVL